MPDERRSTRRARLSGVRVAYESSTGEVKQADVANLSREGLFISSAKPLAVGKRLSLELQVAGEPAAWPALGRIVWVRAVREGDKLPAGMAVKIIDMEDSVAAAIDRLIEARERTEPGLGDAAAPPPELEKPRRQIPAREKTMLGVGIATAPSAPVAAAPVVAAAAPGDAVAAPAADRAVAAAASPNAPVARPMPSREKTMVGVGQAIVDAREPSLAIDLVAKKPASVPPRLATTEPAPRGEPRLEAPPAPEAPAARAGEVREPEEAAERAEPGVSEAPAPRRRGGSGCLLLLVLVACGVAGYAFRERLLPLLHLAVTTVTKELR